jgi:hypothetical protein
MDESHQEKWRRLINGAIRVYLHSTARLANDRGQRHQIEAGIKRFLLGPYDAIAELTIGADLVIEAVCTRAHADVAQPEVWDDRATALWALAEVTAEHLNQHMRPALIGNAQAIDIAARQIFVQLDKVAGVPLLWTWFSFPWDEPGSEITRPSSPTSPGFPNPRRGRAATIP